MAEGGGDCISLIEKFAHRLGKLRAGGGGFFRLKFHRTETSPYRREKSKYNVFQDAHVGVCPDWMETQSLFFLSFFSFVNPHSRVFFH